MHLSLTISSDAYFCVYTTAFKTAPGHVTAYTRRESRHRHNTITEAVDSGCRRDFSGYPFAAHNMGRLFWQGIICFGLKQLSHYEDEMITLVWEIFAESLS